MKRILLSLIAFAGVWMTAGAQANTNGYVPHTENATLELNREQLNHIANNNFVYGHNVNVNGVTVTTTFTLSSLNGKKIEFLKENCLNLHRGTDYKFTWDDSNSNKYSIIQVTPFTIKTAAYQGTWPFDYSEVYLSINNEGQKKISTGRTDKSKDNAYTTVTTNTTFDNGQDGISLVYSGLKNNDQYICYIKCGYKIKYYTLDFTKANDLVSQAEALYSVLSQESKESQNGVTLNSAVAEANTFKTYNENTVVAIGDPLRDQLTTLEEKIQAAIDAFTCELDENAAYDKAGKTVTNVTVKRNLKAGTWNSLCLPFDMPIPTGWNVKELSGLNYDNGSYHINFTTAESIEAGKPYIVNVAKEESNISHSDTKGFSLNGAPVNTNAADKGHSVDFIASYATTGVDQNADNYIIANDKFYFVDTDNVKIRGFHGYFHIDGAVSAPALSISFDEEPTGITTVNAGANSNDNLYNIAGQRVNDNAKGIIIKNGKKYFVK